jgi:hypothetical protein
LGANLPNLFLIARKIVRWQNIFGANLPNFFLIARKIVRWQNIFGANLPIFFFKFARKLFGGNGDA